MRVDHPEIGDGQFARVDIHIITIVNITSNTTSTVTETSAHFKPTPHQTNEEGTRIGTITYTSGGKLVTSTLYVNVHR